MGDESRVSTGGRPEIWTYRDPRVWVADLCAWKQRTERHFSYRKLARFADLGSPGYIQTYMAGRRNLRPETAKRLAGALGMSAEEVEFFVLLTTFEQAADPDERARTYEQILRRAVAHGTGRLDAARLYYFTRWYVPVVHAMASLAGFRPDPAWIAPRVLPAIVRDDARRALRVLFDLGIFRHDDEGRFRVEEPVLEAEDADAESLWIREYHRAMLRLAERSLDLLGPADRLLAGFTVTVPTDRIDEALRWGEETMHELFYRVLGTQEDEEATDGEVLQFSFQGVRLSQVGGGEG